MDTYRKRRILIELGLTILLGLSLGYTWGFKSHTRSVDLVYLTQSLVEGRLAVDTPMSHYGLTVDSRRVGENTYVTILPGLPYVASIPFRLVYGHELPDLKDVQLFLGRFVAIPLTLLGFLAFRRLLRVQLVDDAVIDATSVFIFMGTPVLWAGNHLSVHVFLGLLLCVALTAIHTLESQPLSRMRGTMLGFGAGCALGWGVISHPLGWLMALLTLVYAATGAIRHHRPAMFAMAAATVAGLGLWGYLSHLIAGAPLGLAISKTWDVRCFRDLLSYEHGMLVSAPGLFLGLIGYGVMWQRKVRRRALFYAGSGAILIIAIYVCLPHPAEALPLFAIWVGVGVAFGLDATQMPLAWGLFRGITAAGVVISMSVALVLALTPQLLSDPYWEVLRASLESGTRAPNLVKDMPGKGNWDLLPMLVLTCLATGEVLFRGVSDVGARSRQVTAAILSVTLMFLVIGGVTRVGGTVTEKESKAMLREVDPLHQQQRGMNKGMNKVIKQIDGL